MTPAFAGRDRRVKLRVFLDKRVMEVYANDSEAAVFEIIRAGREDIRIGLFARDGNARFDGLKAWQMRPARFSLGYYTVPGI